MIRLSVSAPMIDCSFTMLSFVASSKLHQFLKNRSLNALLVSGSTNHLTVPLRPSRNASIRDKCPPPAAGSVETRT